MNKIKHVLNLCSGDRSSCGTYRRQYTLTITRISDELRAMLTSEDFVPSGWKQGGSEKTFFQNKLVLNLPNDIDAFTRKNVKNHDSWARPLL